MTQDAGRRTERANASDRRAFLRLAASAGLLAAGCSAASERREAPASEDAEAEVTPGEDLMQEHGVLERVLLIYDETIRRANGGGVDVAPVLGAAQLVQRFVEDYHERNEERFVFPRLEAAGPQRELVATLRLQH